MKLKRCDNCGGPMLVINTRAIGTVIQRKNLCQRCNRISTTYEAENPELRNMIMEMMRGDLSLLNRLTVDEIRSLIAEAYAAIDHRKAAQEEASYDKRVGRRSRKTANP